jgi:uncharacterized membrane protein YeiH
VTYVFERPDDTALGGGLGREVLLGRVLEPESWMAQELPAQLLAVTAVRGIGEEPFLQVSAQHLKEDALGRDIKIGECILL